MATSTLILLELDGVSLAHVYVELSTRSGVWDKDWGGRVRDHDRNTDRSHLVGKVHSLHAPRVVYAGTPGGSCESMGYGGS